MPERPLVLAFDTSAAHCAAALLSGGAVLASVEEPMAKGQGERLFGLLDEVLGAAGVGFGDLDALGVGIGPGNFTGIRISVAAARGLALGLGIPAVGVSGLEALALGQAGPCLCAVDARRGQVYVQGFDVAGYEAPRLVEAGVLAEVGVPVIGAGGLPPVFPLAEAMARLAAERGRGAAPAPLYLRPADAAPARDAPPEIIA